MSAINLRVASARNELTRQIIRWGLRAATDTNLCIDRVMPEVDMAVERLIQAVEGSARAGSTLPLSQPDESLIEAPDEATKNELSDMLFSLGETVTLLEETVKKLEEGVDQKTWDTDGDGPYEIR